MFHSLHLIMNSVEMKSASAPSTKSASAPSTPTEQTKQLHSGSVKRKDKRQKVHFPVDEMLVTCYLEPPDPWSRVVPTSLDDVITSYVAACDKQGIKPIPCVLDQLQEFAAHANELEENKRTFDLSIIGEKLSVRHCETLEEIFRRIQFRLIDLEGSYLEDEGAAALFDMIEYYDSASQLNISFTKHIDCRGWQACSRMLKKTSSLNHLNARSTGLNEQVLLILGRSLRLGSNLITLHFENCGIFGRCLVILVAALKLNTTLRELFLAENKISSSDGFQLGNLLRTNTHLELLDLSNNKLEDDGLVNLMESLGQQSNTSGRGLSTLILWNNELTHKGMTCVAKAVNSARTLKRLNLGSNDITSAGILELKQSFICNQTMETLELENAKITSEGAIALAEYISVNQILERLDLRGNNISLTGLKALTQSMKNNIGIISLQVDYTPLDLNESVKDREYEIQEITKYSFRNKEKKSNIPAQDAQLSTLFNGIFSRVLPAPVMITSKPKQDLSFKKDILFLSDKTATKSAKNRFRVSPVSLDVEVNSDANFENSSAYSPDEVVPCALTLVRLSGSCHVDKDSVISEDSISSIKTIGQLVSNDLSADSVVANDLSGEKCESSDNIVTNRIRWLENLSDSSRTDVFPPTGRDKPAFLSHIDVSDAKLSPCSENLNNLKIKIPQSFNVPCHENVASHILLAENGNLRNSNEAKMEKMYNKSDLFLPLKDKDDIPVVDQKERRLSSPAVPSAAAALPRKAHSIKCGKRLEGLDLCSSVPLSPTKRIEGFSFPEPPLEGVSLSSQNNMKPSQTLYMVH